MLGHSCRNKTSAQGWSPGDDLGVTGQGAPVPLATLQQFNKPQVKVSAPTEGPKASGRFTGRLVLRASAPGMFYSWIIAKCQGLV